MTSIQKQIGRFYRLFTYRIGTMGTPDLIELEDGKVKMNGYPLFACRAWVNFDGQTAANQAATYSRTGTTVTVTLAAHGYLTGHVVYCNFTSGGALDGIYTITGVPTADTFTLTTAASGTIAAGSTLDLNRCLIRGSGNVHSVSYLGVGIYAVNFARAFADNDYAIIPGGNPITNGSSVVFPGIEPYNATTEYASTVSCRVGATGSGSAPTKANLPFFTVAIFR